jgi:hypothetical protein
MKTWSEDYKGHTLICTPQRLFDGRFRAKLWIQKDLTSGVQEIPVGVKPGVYNSEEDAANASRIAGQQWVDDQN